MPATEGDEAMAQSLRAAESLAAERQRKLQDAEQREVRQH